MKKLLSAALVLAATLAFAPAQAALTTTKTIEIPVGGTYDRQFSSSDYIVRCRTGVSGGNPAACVPQERVNGAGDQKPVTGDVTIERGSLARPHRCLYITDAPTAQSSTTGHLGYTFNVAGEGGSTFALTAITNPTVTDFDITFYTEGLGGCAVDPPAAETTFNFSKLGNESGAVPAGSDFAIVTMFAGAPNSQFRLVIS